MLDLIKATYKVAIYIRLSKEDENKGINASESVSNQKILLTNFVQKLGLDFELVDTYIDDGYTGTNFNRPNFQRMIRDIELGKINTVIVKDLSRLGRNYIESGDYIENWFPEHNVRFFSVNDAIDSFDRNNSNNDIAPVKSVLNEWQSRDTSKKIREILHSKQQAGQWVGGKIAMGYKKDPNDKNHLIICENEAEIIKTIFDMAYSGKTIGEIKNYLNDNNIPTCNNIRYNNISFWENKTIKNILKNEVYIGTSIQNKRSRISYKNRKFRTNPKEEWNIVENTHEPIIDKKIFDRVQNMVIVQKYNRNEKKHHFLLDGLLVCYECKHKIGVQAKNNGRYLTTCNNYRRNSKLSLCTSHGFNYEKLENEVLRYIREIFSSIENKQIELSIEKNMTKYDYSKMIEKKTAEIKALKDNMDKMYIEKLDGKIDEEMYNRIYDNFEKEIIIKNKELTEYKEKKDNSEQDDIEQIRNLVKDFLNLENPTPEIMRVIINRIEIHQDKQIDIVFNFKKLNLLKEKKYLF